MPDCDIAELDALIDEILLSSRLDAVKALDAREEIDLLALAAEEGARYAMIWAGMLGATVAFRWRRDPVLLKLRAVEQGRGRQAGRVLRAVAAVLFLGPIWLYSLLGPNYDVARGFLARSAERNAEVIGLPMVWFTCIIPIAITVIFVHVGAQLAGAPTQSEGGS
jgi:TRAP-type C4-dicarboxylate transport system permease small subunit